MNQETEQLDLERAKEAMTGASPQAPSSYLDSRNKASLEGIELAGREQFFSLRKTWSWSLLIWMSVLLFLETVVTLLVGFGLLNYLEYKWFLITVFSETFLQIIAMGFVVVKFLYALGRPLDIR